jgi:hypothetical protein
MLAVSCIARKPRCALSTALIALFSYAVHIVGEDEVLEVTRRAHSDVPRVVEMKRRVYPVCIRSTDERCGSEHDNSCDECCHVGIRQDFIENSGHCHSPVRLPLFAPSL